MEVDIKKTYYNNGNLYREESYLNNILHGVQKNYHVNGKIREISHFKKGTCFNVRQLWEADQSRRFIQTWKNQEFNGFQIYFKYER